MTLATETVRDLTNNRDGVVNSSDPDSVESKITHPRNVRAVALVGLAVMLMMNSGCVEIDGGAVELSWSIRTPDGMPSSCELRQQDPEVGLGEVRLCWSGSLATANCDGRHLAAFPCRDEHGVTNFEIDPGRTAIWIQPVCAGGSLPPSDRFEVPPPIVREIVHGEVATLNALLIVARDDACTP